MTENIIEIDQIHADAVLIVVRGDFTRFSSLECAKSFREHMEELACKTEKPVIMLNHTDKVEGLNDSQLEAIGLQRILNI